MGINIPHFHPAAGALTPEKPAHPRLFPHLKPATDTNVIGSRARRQQFRHWPKMAQTYLGFWWCSPTFIPTLYKSEGVCLYRN